MESKLIKNKKAAMEMSVGTIVTIVLLMTVLILGLVMVRTIFKVATGAIDLTNTQLTSEINKLFSEDNTKQVAIYPPAREISIKKGELGGFGFGIRNTYREEGVFSYTVTSSENSCNLDEDEANSFIILGASGDNIKIGSGDVMQNSILVKYSIPESTPLCNIRYILNVDKDEETYLSGGVSVDLEIKAK